jgi:hypothetical protein
VILLAHPSAMLRIAFFLAGTVLTGTTQAQISTAALKLRLDFEGSGQTASDASGNGNDCRLGSTAGSDANDPTRVSEGLQFDGGDFVDCLQATFGSTSLMAQGSESFTVQVVGLQPSDATSMFLARSTGAQTTFELGSLAASGVRATLRGTSTVIESPTPTSAWHLWTVRWDGSAATGRQDHGADAVLGVGSTTDSAETLAIGARSISTGGASFLPNGSKVALVLLYDRALEDAEMRRQYCAIRDEMADKSVALQDANCPSADTTILSSLTFMGAPMRVASVGAPTGGNEVTMTDCEIHSAAVWAGSGQPPAPFEVAAADTQLGDACDPFNSKHPVRQ